MLCVRGERDGVAPRSLPNEGRDPVCGRGSHDRVPIADSRRRGVELRGRHGLWLSDTQHDEARLSANGTQKRLSSPNDSRWSAPDPIRVHSTCATTVVGRNVPDCQTACDSPGGYPGPAAESDEVTASVDSTVPTILERRRQFGNPATHTRDRRLGETWAVLCCQH